MNKCTGRLYNGIVKENPTFVLTFDMYPTLTVTTSAVNGLGTGLSATVVLLFSNIIISALRKIIPDRVRTPTYIVIVTSLVIMAQLLFQTYVPGPYSALGICIPLIVVNCIILGRTEPYASKNGPVVSTFDDLSMGLGFTLTLTCIGLIREILGSGAIFGNVVTPEDYHITISVLTPNTLFILAILAVLQNKFKVPSATNGSPPQFKLACGSNCISRTNSTYMANHEALGTRIRQAREKVLTAKKTAVAKKEAELKSATSKKENQESGQIKELLLIAIGSALVNNTVLSQFLGFCPFLGVSKKVEIPADMDAAVISVTVIAPAATSLVYTGVLVNLHPKYLQTIMFVLVIVAPIQFVEMFLKKSMSLLYEALGVYLPLITTSCAILDVVLTNAQKSYSFIQGVVSSIDISVGFTIVIITLADIRKKIEHNDVPYSFQGSSIILIASGLMAIASFGSFELT